MADDTTGPGFDAEPMGPEVVRAKAAEVRRAELDTNAPHVGAFLQESLALMKARATGQAKPIPVPWEDVAERLGGGLWPGLHVLTGATGQGKTQFALQVAWTAAGKNVPVLYIGLELDRLGVTTRLLALAEGEATGRTPQWSNLYLGKTDLSELERLVGAHGPALNERPLRAEFGPPHGWSYATLHERVRALREEYPEPEPGGLPLLVVLDFLQAVGAPEGAREDLRERISRAAYAGRAVARDFGAAVLMLSSTSRDNARKSSEFSDTNKEGVTPETPASDLVGMGKESGDIEYAADTVMALCPGPFNELNRPMRLAVAKVRAGRSGWCELEFNGATFSEAAQYRTIEPEPRGKAKKASANMGESMERAEAKLKAGVEKHYAAAAGEFPGPGQTAERLARVRFMVGKAGARPLNRPSENQEELIKAAALEAGHEYQEPSDE